MFACSSAIRHRLITPACIETVNNDIKLAVAKEAPSERARRLEKRERKRVELGDSVDS